MATCKDCVHFDVCCSYLSTAYNKCKLATPDFKLLKNIECDECQHFKDHSRFVELPCKIDDTVYIALNGYGVLKDTIKEFRITSRRIWIRPEKFGMDCLLENMAFLTRKEAEAALKERENND